MKPMTKQEVFDKVATHLLTQKKRSYDNGSCAYRAKDGSMCAAGCLIPDEEYTPDLEGWHVTACYPSKGYMELIPARPAFVKLFEGWDKEVVAFLRDLQDIHDNINADTWASHLETTAKSYGLNTDVLLKVR